MPTAGADNVGDIVQFVGTTTASYTNGYFYKCVSDGADPATYSWEEVEVQASSGGGLPDQTGQSGKFLTTDGTDASWGTINALQNTATGANSLTILGTPSTFRDSLNIGPNSQTYYNYTLAIGKDAKALGMYSVAIGISSTASNTNARVIGTGTASGTYSLVLGAGEVSATGATQIGSTWGTNAVANTVKFANQNGNFEMMSADGTIPEARLADTTNATAGQVLTLDSNLNAVWATGGSGGGVSDVTVNGTSVVSGGVAAITCATIDDTSTSSLTATWSASKLNTTIGDIETLINAL